LNGTEEGSLETEEKASVAVNKFVPLFTQKTINTKFDELSIPKSGPNINIPKEAMTKPFSQIETRDEMLKKIEQRQKKALEIKQRQKHINDRVKAVRHKAGVGKCYLIIVYC
jgi:hypothetical protein